MKILILFLVGLVQFSSFADVTEVYVKSVPVVQRYEAEVDIASAGTTTLSSVKSGNLRVTGTTGITSFGAATAGTYKHGRFAGVLTMTHSSNLILPGAVNFTTAANDRFEAFCLSSGTWILKIDKADGTAIVGGAGGGDFSSNTSSSTNNNIIIFSGTGGKTGKDSKIATDGNGNIRTPGTIETGADAGTAGATAWGDGNGHTYRISPQTMSGSANFQPDTAPTTGIPLHTATSTNVVETHLGSSGSGNVARVTGATLAGTTLGTATINYAYPLASDDTSFGMYVTGLNNSGGVTQWDVVYLNSSSQWVLADANGSGTYPAWGLATATATTGNATTVIVQGIIRNDGWAWTPGASLFLSTTAGGLTATAPSTTGDKVQVIGKALSATTVLLRPSQDYGTAP